MNLMGKMLPWKFVLHLFSSHIATLPEPLTQSDLFEHHIATPMISSTNQIHSNTLFIFIMVNFLLLEHLALSIMTDAFESWLGIIFGEFCGTPG